MILCGGLGTDIGDVNGGAATGEFWDRYWGCCMIIVNTVGVGAWGWARGRNLDVNISWR